MCGHGQLLAALQNHGNPVAQRCAKLLPRPCGQSNLHFFFDWRQKFCTQTAPRFGVQKRIPKTGGQVVRTKQIKLRLNKWPPFLESVSGLQKGGRFWTPKMEPFVGEIFGYRAKNGKSFDCFCTYAAVPLLFHGFAAPRNCFCWVFGPQTGVQKNHFFRSLKGAKSCNQACGSMVSCFFRQSVENPFFAFCGLS